MKKILLLIFSLLLLAGCETQEEANKRKREEEIQRITEDLEKKEVPEKAKQWLIDIKMNQVITVLCLTSSKKCATYKETIDKVSKDSKIISYFYNLDELDDNVKSILKSEFTIDDYTGYVPFTILSSNNKLIDTYTDMMDEEKLIEFLTINKIISKVSTN